MKRIITVKLSRKEADALLNAGNRGIADLHDAGFDEDLDAADIADAALSKIGAAMTAAGWYEDAETE